MFKVIPQLVQTEKTIPLEDVLDQINSKDKDVESFEQYHLEVIEQLDKKSQILLFQILKIFLQ